MNIKKSVVFLTRNYPYKLRNWLYKRVGFEIYDCDIRTDVTFTNPSDVMLGNGCLINHGTSFVTGRSKAKIIIEDNVFIGPHCLITTVTHQIGETHQRAGELKYLPIHIGKGVWIGASCTICPGVSIGEGAVIAGGAVVVCDIEPNVLVGGVPAKVIRKL